MKFAAVSLACLAICIAFSGCSGGKGVETSTDTGPGPTTTSRAPHPLSTDEPTPTNTTASNSTAPPDNETKEPVLAPTANLTANATNGTVPFDVAFTLGDDAQEDGGPYNYTVDFGDNETINSTTASLPYAFNHTFDEVGNYTINVTIENAAGSSAASVAFEALDNATQIVTGEYSFGTLACGGPYDEWDFDDTDGLTHVQFAVNDTTWNGTFNASFDGDGDPNAVDFYDEDGALLESVSMSDAIVNGTIPIDAAMAVLWGCDLGGGGSVVYRGFAPAPGEQTTEEDEGSS